MTETKINSESTSYQAKNALEFGTKSFLSHSSGALLTVLVMICCGLGMNIAINNAYNGSAAEIQNFVSIVEPVSRSIFKLLGQNDDCEKKFDGSTNDSLDLIANQRAQDDCKKASITRTQTMNTAVWNIFSVIFFSILVMIITRNAPVNIKQVYCDTIYYYGFLLTLFSLVLAFTTARVGTDADVVPIIINNAIALSSTFAALLFRVMFNLIIKIEENRTDVISDYERHIFIFIDSLTNLTKSVNRFQGNIDNYGDAVKESTDRYIKTVSSLYSRYDTLIFTIDTQSRKINDELIEISNSISVHTNRIKTEMSQYNVEQKLDTKINASIINLNRKLENSTTKINQSIQDTSSTVDQLGASLNILRQNIDIMSQNLASSELRVFTPRKTLWQRFHDIFNRFANRAK